MKDQIRSQGTSVVVEDGIAPDIAELLKQIRAQYEQMVAKNRDEAEQWYKSKVTFCFCFLILEGRSS